jgi:hypothetical protein
MTSINTTPASNGQHLNTTEFGYNHLPEARNTGSALRATYIHEEVQIHHVETSSGNIGLSWASRQIATR